MRRRKALILLSSPSWIAFGGRYGTELKLNPSRVVEDKVVTTTCPYCGVGCSLELHVKDDFIYKVTSPFDLPVNHGNLCVKGRFGYDFIYHPKRVTTPLVRRYLLEGNPNPKVVNKFSLLVKMENRLPIPKSPMIGIGWKPIGRRR